MKIVYIQPSTSLNEVCKLGNLMSISLPDNPEKSDLTPRGAPRAKTV